MYDKFNSLDCALSSCRSYFGGETKKKINRLVLLEKKNVCAYLIDSKQDIQK